MTEQETERQAHLRKLLAIHERRIYIILTRVVRYYQGNRDNLPISDLIQLEDDEERVREINRELMS